MTATSVDGQSDTAPTDDLMLSLSDITVRFGGITALNGVSFDARAGEVLGIIGPTAPGKTTLFDVISGVRAAERRARAPRRHATSRRRRHVQRARRGLRRTFQRVQTFGWLTVEDNVLAALEWRGGGGGFVADLVPSPPAAAASATGGSASTRCSSAAVSPRCASELAGSLPIGVARMVEFARAIVDEPKLLLARRTGVGSRRDRDRAPRRADPGGPRRHRVRGAPRRAQRRVRHGAERPGRRARPRHASWPRVCPTRSSATRPCATPTSARPRSHGRRRRVEKF